MAETFSSLKGQLLLDGGKLHGSFFHRTVVLLCEHNAEGAFGLVLNRATKQTVGDALTADLSDRLKTQPVWHGGPVQPGALSFLHTDTFLPDAKVLPNLNLGHSLDELQELGASYSPTQQLKIFAGYAGWSPGQLENELAREAWLMHPASVELIFQQEPALLWKTILQLKGPQYRLMAEEPEDLSWN